MLVAVFPTLTSLDNSTVVSNCEVGRATQPPGPLAMAIGYLEKCTRDYDHTYHSCSYHEGYCTTMTVPLPRCHGCTVLPSSFDILVCGSRYGLAEAEWWLIKSWGHGEFGCGCVVLVRAKEDSEDEPLCSFMICSPRSLYLLVSDT